MSKKLPRGQVIELGGEPRINFLPPEIQERKDARRRRRALLMLVVAIAVLCGIGYFYAAQFATERQAALEREQELTIELLTQQAQYREARTLSEQVTLTGTAIAHVTHNEVMWRAILNDVTAALPSGVSLTEWSITGTSALEYPQPTSGLFPLERVANIDLVVVVNNLATLSGAIDSLQEVPGVVGIGVTSAQLDPDQGGYVSTLTVVLGPDVLEGRFADGWVPGTLTEPSAAPPADPETEADEPETGESESNETEDGGE